MIMDTQTIQERRKSWYRTQEASEKTATPLRVVAEVSGGIEDGRTVRLMTNYLLLIPDTSGYAVLCVPAIASVATTSGSSLT